MTFTISLSPEAEARLKAKATIAGIDVETYAARTLERFAIRMELEELLAPLRAEFSASGITDDELTELLEDAKHESRKERS